jgi:manganese transport protein
MAIAQNAYLRKFGPGIITAALVFGPGSLTINTKLGASFGFSLIWVILIAMVFMSVFTRMSAKIGLVSQVSFIERIKQELGKPLAILVGIGVFLTTASFQAGNTIGASVAFAELFSTSYVLWLTLFTALAIGLLFFESFYKILEKAMIGLVVLMLVSFLITIVMAAPSLTLIFKGMVPSIPSGSEYLIITLTASSFSIVGAFYQSYLVKEKGWKSDEASDCMKESQTGIIILGLLSTMVMICAASVLHQKDIDVKNASDLGMALEPLFGSFTSKAFMIGFFAASFSSMVGNATIGGVILADTFFSESKLSHIKVRIMIMLVITIGAIVAFIFGSLPLQLIIFAQGITVMLVPLAAIIILLFANKKDVNIENKKVSVSNIIGVLGILVLLLMSGYSINYLLF